MATVYDVTARAIMTPLEKIKRVDASEKISTVVGILAKEGLHSVLVFDGPDYIGVFGHEQLIRLQNVPPTSAKVGHFVTKPASVDPSTNLAALADIMFRNNLRLVPVIEKGRLLGVISERDVLNAAVSLGELAGKTVAELMSPDPLCVREKDKIGTALALMRDYRVSRLPVTDKEGRVVGLLESPEIMRRIVTAATPESRPAYYGYRQAPGVVEEFPVYRVIVRELMNSRPVLAKEGDMLTKKIDEMRRMGQTTLIVVNEAQEPVGILAPRDVVEWLAAFKAPTGIYMQISGLDPTIIGSFAEAQLHRMIEETVRKLATIMKIREFAVHFKTYHETFDRVRFSLRARVHTDHGLFTAAKHGWDIIAVANELFDDIERRVIEAERRHEDIRRARERRTKTYKKSF